MKVAVARTDSRIVYEWRIEVGAELDPDRVIGFDVSVADKDKDGSFSWAAWGSGTQKTRDARPVRRDPPRQPGDAIRRGLRQRGLERPVPGGPPLPGPDPVVAAPPQLWRGAVVDSSGAYKATLLPAGPYSVHVVDSADLRVDAKPHVDVRVEPDRLAKADLLRVTPIPWPGLIGAEGVLRTVRSREPGRARPLRAGLPRLLQDPRHLGRRHQGFEGRLSPRLRREEHGDQGAGGRRHGVRGRLDDQARLRLHRAPARGPGRPRPRYAALYLSPLRRHRPRRPIQAHHRQDGADPPDRIPELEVGQARHQVHPRHPGLVFRRGVRLPRQGRRAPHRQETGRPVPGGSLRSAGDRERLARLERGRGAPDGHRPCRHIAAAEREARPGPTWPPACMSTPTTTRNS